MSLTVYSSSAGSGKTTTLVNEYLKIALDKPNHFRHILAITFTNKAANEMKSRVIDTLKDLSDDNIPVSAKLNDLVVGLNIDIPLLRNRAQILLHLILHNYDEFAISTIDSFIHRIIRTFATDVHLPQNFEVVIDQNDIIPEIIQHLFEKVGNDRELTKLLIDFVLSETDEENNYDPTSKIVEFIKHHIKEDGFEHVKKLDNLSLAQLSEIIQKLAGKIAASKSDIKSIADQAIQLCENNNLVVTDFFQGKTGILGYFEKIRSFKVPDDKLFPGKNVVKTISEDKWTSSKVNESTKNTIFAISEELTTYYNQLQEIIQNYFFLRLVYGKIYSLGLIHEIRNLFAEFTEESGKVHISEFNKKISNEIANQPVPFIYERLGRKYRYFLIDEFQDTSILQWQNLLPLIEESLSYSRFNMLVGDAKQAIYRFRSGEVELFNSLPDLYGNDGSQISMDRQETIRREYNPKNLSINWRSKPEIIKFNNDFYANVISSLSDRTKDIYKDLTQTIPEHKNSGGFVSLNFFEAENTDDYINQKHNRIKEILEQIFEHNYRKKDICVLCRTKRHAIGIAEFLIDSGINVVSSETLLLTNSPKVRLIISFLKLQLSSDNEIAFADFTNNYVKIVNPNIDFNSTVGDFRRSSSSGIKKIFSLFGIEATERDIAPLSTYEVAEFVLREIIKTDEPDVFVQYLLDFISESGLPLKSFLSKWEEKNSQLFITMPENIDAVRIMTIHKAKGLDFPIVIVDAENVKNQNTRSEYWENISIEGITELKVGLFPLTRKIELIDRLHIYEDEVRKTELDFLNVIYVATTRPVEALYTVSQLGTKDKFNEYLYNYLNTKGIWQESQMLYEFGKLDEATNVYDNNGEESIKLEKFISSNWTDLITVAHSDSVIHDALSGKSSRSYGNLIHSILSKIESKKESTAVINQLKDSGILNANELLIIEDIVNKVVNHPDLNQFFSDNILVKNETEILLDNGEISRPDRVILHNNKITIIDYKTGAEKEKDHVQLRNYEIAFKKLGYQDISLLLVYLTDAVRIVEV